MNSNLLNKIENFVINKFKTEKNDNLIYHNLEHTIEVVDACKEISASENLSDEDLEMLLVAAWFHDIGYLENSKEHEEVSANMAKEFLTLNNYPEYKISIIISSIMATKIPQIPQNIIEAILCDADLLHLGKKGLMKKTELLKIEIETSNNTNFRNNDWLEKTKTFLENHNFHTKYAKDNYDSQKFINYNKLINKLDTYEIKPDNSHDNSFLKEKTKIKNEKANRGIETMFRNTMRTHVSFSSMADNKANIMISVNTLILTAIVAVFSRTLQLNQHLIIPTLILTLTSLSTLIFAILVTRPKVNSGKFTNDDIKQKKANLLFFGNFFEMKIDDFIWGMKEVINDSDYLYDSMIKDFYFLGQVLGKKYKYLRICYNTFLIGIILSVISFLIAILIYPETNLVFF